jgi:CheY-like chemotaxis protein
MAETSGERTLSTVQLVGFSPRDSDLLRLFLRRPPGSGMTLHVVDTADADLLIANMAMREARDAVKARNKPSSTIGLVAQFSSDAAFYQVQQNSQLLYSLAQGINRIREGWVPPHLATHAEEVAATAASNANLSEEAARPPASHRHEHLLDATPATPAMREGGDVAAATAATQSVAANPHASLPWQRSLSILVIDDSNFSRVAIQEALGKVGFSVETAHDGEDGLRMAEAKHYDVALVDFEMPGMKGPEVIRKLRALATNAPQLVIMLTSRTGAVDRLRAKIAGCDAYLTKPTKMSEFVAVLTQFAGQGRLKRN